MDFGTALNCYNATGKDKRKAYNTVVQDSIPIFQWDADADFSELNSVATHQFPRRNLSTLGSTNILPVQGFASTSALIGSNLISPPESRAARDELPNPEDYPSIHKTTDEAGQQITRNNYHWGTTLGAATGPISFGFRSSAPSYSVTGENVQGTFSPFSIQEQIAARAALSLWASVANINFTDLGVSNDATMEFGNYSSFSDNSEAFAFFPTSNDQSAGSYQGDVFINTNYASTVNDNPGTYEFMTFLHEIGHALGLEHPGAYNAGPSGIPTYLDSAQYVEDTRMYSLMSYFSESYTGAYFSGIYDEVPMLDDIAAIQRLYGRNNLTRIGNTTYGFNSNAGLNFEITSADQDLVMCIYDAGGSNKLDFSGYYQDATINLNPETFSSVGGSINNISLAQTTSIQSAIGGSGNDVIILNNSLASIVSGGDGADTFRASQYGWLSSIVTDLSTDDKINFTDADPTHFTYKWHETTLTNTGNGYTTTLSNNPVGHLITQSDGSSGTNLTLANANPTLNDFSGDGRSDIIWGTASGAVVEWQMNDKVPSSSTLIGNDPSWSLITAGVGDFNGDHQSDILQKNSAGQVLEWQMDGASLYSAGIIGGDNNWSVVGSGDFDGDGKTDLLWRSAGGTLVEWLMNGFVPASSVAIGNDASWTVVGTGDFNGDGKSDILQKSAATGQVLEWDMNGSSATSAGLIGGDMSWSIAGTGDFDGDGKSDIIWQNSSGPLAEWLMNDRVPTQMAVIGGDPNWTYVGSGDFTDSGRDAILQRSSLTGQVLQWDMDGTSVVSAGLIGGDQQFKILTA